MIQPAEQQVADADAGQVAEGEQRRFEGRVLGEQGGEQIAQQAPQPAWGRGQARVTQQYAEQDGIGGPEGRQQAGRAGEDADK
ncbi:hypothetical protein D3C80_853490 [compost metagenome]